jgi:uncharacterized SAM-binding protein YcdF (DUF218 family)
MGQNGTMLALSKLIGMLCMPTGLLWLGLLLAMFWAFRRRVPGLGAFLAFLFLAFTLAGNPQVGALLMDHLESTIPSLPEKAAPFDAVFVLGGGSQLDDQGRPILGGSGDRIIEAARLWHAGKVRCLVASGTSDDARTGRRNLGAETREIWESLGVPRAAIREIEEPCFITRDEIQAYRRLMVQEGWHRVGLLSSAWHLPRAMALAKRAGLEVLPIPSDERGRVSRFQLWHLVPQEEGFQKTQLACWEMLGRRVGR